MILALTNFAGAVFLAIPMVWKIVGYLFGVLNLCTIAALSVLLRKDKEITYREANDVR